MSEEPLIANLRDGAIAVIDALGFKGIWNKRDQDPRVVIAKLEDLRKTANFFEASPMTLRSFPSSAVLSAVADATKSVSPLAPASLMSASTTGLFSVAVAANSPAVAQLNFGNGGRTPTTTATMMRKPNQTAIQSSLLKRVKPFLFSGIGTP